MTLEDAAQRVLKNLQGLTNAMRVASHDGNPILTPDGRPVQVRAPGLGDVLLGILQAQHLQIEFLLAVTRALESGFTLSDEETARISEVLRAGLGLDNRRLHAVDVEAKEERHEADSAELPGKLKQ